MQVQCQGPLSAYQHYFSDREQEKEGETFIAEIKKEREGESKKNSERRREFEREIIFLVKILSRCKNFPRKIKTGTNEVT